MSTIKETDMIFQRLFVLPIPKAGFSEYMSTPLTPSIGFEQVAMQTIRRIIFYTVLQPMKFREPLFPKTPIIIPYLSSWKVMSIWLTRTFLQVCHPNIISDIGIV
jgi:hypothetical protein